MVRNLGLAAALVATTALTPIGVGWAQVQPPNAGNGPVGPSGVIPYGMSDLPPAGPLHPTDLFQVCQQVPCPAGTQLNSAPLGALPTVDYPVTKPQYGAVCDGVTDDHAAIQAAINDAGAHGSGEVVIPPGTCYLGTTGIQVGTGGDGTFSSYGSVVLVGKGGPGSIYPMPSGVPRLTYAGDGAAVKFAGPLQGWGVRHLRIDCTKLTSPSSIGLLFVSSSYGVSQDFAVQNCFQDMLGTTVNITPTGGTVGQANTNNNVFSGFQLMIGEGGAAATGLTALHLSGGSSGGTVTGDSFFNTFDNGLIEACATNSITENGIYLDIADSNRFKDVLIATCTGPPSTFRSIVVDWSVPVSSGYFPAADIFDRVDTNPTRAGTVSYTFIGTPQPGTQEWFTNITTNNGDFYPPIQPGVYTDHSLGSWTPTLRGSSSAGTPTYVNQAGNYTSSGYAIAAYFVVEASSLGGAAGNLQIGGLPIPMSNSTVVDASCALSLTQGWNSAVSGVSQVTGQISNGQSVVGLNEIGNNANAASPVASWHTSPTTVKIVGLCNYPRV